MKYLTFILLFLVPDSEIHCARIVKDIQVNNPQRKSAQACEQFGIPPRRLSSRIINGIRAEIDEFPHYALLWKKNKIDGSIKFRCGGTLISESFVLTAAHCKWKMCYENITECIVRLGTNILDEKSQDYSGIDKKILRFMAYDNYTIYKRVNDIALIELQEKVFLNYNIWPACLVQENPVEQYQLLVAGFGVQSVVNSLNTSDVLLKAQVREVSLEECRYNYTFHRVPNVKDNIFDTHLCAKNKIKHQDACEGDSGSGLVLEQEGTYFVAGIVSFGLSCNTSLPAFYTRVWSYLDWIENIVWPEL